MLQGAGGRLGRAAGAIAVRALCRGRSTTPTASPAPDSSAERVPFSFQIGASEPQRFEVATGTTLLEAARTCGVDLEGACEGSLACSTCHVVLEPEVYAMLPEPGDEENDMLDLAYGLTPTSRLGCQVRLAPSLRGAVFRIPEATRNLAVDGFKPQPH